MKHPIRFPTWRCRVCCKLLGVYDGDHVEVRYKTARYRARGEVVAWCRRCGVQNRIDTLADCRRAAAN